MRHMHMTKSGLLLLIALVTGGCQSLVNYQDSLYVPDNKQISRGPDYPWCPGEYHYSYPMIGKTITFRALGATPNGGACAPKGGLFHTDEQGRAIFDMNMYMDYGSRHGAAVGYSIGMLDDRRLKEAAWLARILIPAVEGLPPPSRDDSHYKYPSGKIVDGSELVMNGLVWKHRFVLQYEPYYDSYGTTPASKFGALASAYEVYVHKLKGGQLLYVKGDYNPEVVADPSWIAARRKTLRDMVDSVHVDPIAKAAAPTSP